MFVGFGDGRRARNQGWQVPEAEKDKDMDLPLPPRAPQGTSPAGTVTGAVRPILDFGPPELEATKLKYLS